MPQLTNKTALVTGASGGIGEAIALALHKAGAKTAATGRNKDKLDELVKNAGEGGGIIPLIADLADKSAVAGLIDAAEKALGKSVDILVNNAGITKDGLAMRMKDEDWQSVLDVNLTAAFTLSRASLRAMMKNRWGRIINITSVVGVMGNPGQANYCAAKAGMIGMSKSLAAEIASRGITVNCIAPGFIKTNMTDALNEEQSARITANIPAGRFGTPEDIAACALFLAGEQSAYITGQTLHVNGGLLMV